MAKKDEPSGARYSIWYNQNHSPEVPAFILAIAETPEKPTATFCGMELVEVIALRDGIDSAVRRYAKESTARIYKRSQKL